MPWVNTSRSRVETVSWAFLDGGTFISALLARTPRMASMISSMAFSSWGKSSPARCSGHCWSIR